jgi:hypothetical protein
VAIIIVVAIIVAVYVVVTNRNNANNNGGKRSIEVRGIAWDGEKPVSKVYAQSKIVIPGVDYDGDSPAPLARFAGGERVRGVPVKVPEVVARKVPIVGQEWHGDAKSAKMQRRYVIDWKPEDAVGSDE